MDEDKIAFTVGFGEVARIDIEKELQKPVSEGIDSVQKTDGSGAEVSYNPTHDFGVDSSAGSNPTEASLDVSDAVKIGPGTVKVFSILRRTAPSDSSVGTDGNPLIYAYKNEKGYSFRSENDRKAIEADVKAILAKFVEKYFSEIGDKPVTVVLPSGSGLNQYFAELFESAASNAGHKTVLYGEVLEKVGTDVIREQALDDARSELNRWFGTLPEKERAAKKRRLLANLDQMDKEHGGTFSYHYVSDPKTRNALSVSMKLSDDAVVSGMFKDINGSDVILLDDSISRGKSMMEAIGLLIRHYSPKTVTGLTMFSPVSK